MPEATGTVEVDFVAPRHLADRGDPAWITVPLHRACGWSYGHDPLMPRVILSSPDQKTLLRLDPNPDGQGWTLTQAAQPGRPAWYASFGARTPVELIGAVTDTLTAPASATHPRPDPYEPLQQIGWSPDLADDLASPDNTAFVEYLGTPNKPGTWAVTVTLGPRQQVWQARFGEHTPPHLITAFTTALADTAPLPRTAPSSIASSDPHLITRTTRVVPATQLASALEDRVRSLAARRATPPAHPTPKPPPPAPRRSR